MNSYFDEIATEWEKLRESFFSDRVREKAILAASVGAGGVAADIGAGTGFITEGLVRRGVKVIAVDESEKMLDELSRRMPVSGVERRVGSAERIPIEDEAVDYVFANMLLHHVEEPSRAIREMARVLRPGGGRRRHRPRQSRGRVSQDRAARPLEGFRERVSVELVTGGGAHECCCGISRRGLLHQIFERRCGGDREHLLRFRMEAR